MFAIRFYMLVYANVQLHIGVLSSSCLILRRCNGTPRTYIFFAYMYVVVIYE